MFLKLQNWRFVRDAESRVKPPNDKFVVRRSNYKVTLIPANASFDSMFADHVIIAIQLKCL